jgi:hypothetical protein
MTTASGISRLFSAPARFNRAWPGHDARVETVRDAATQRAAGDEPSRFKSLLASAIVGVAAAIATYRLLRSGTSKGTNEDGGSAASTER